MSIGYEVLVNSLQIANAYNTVANNGMMMKPYIVKKEMSNDSRTIFESRPTQIRQVISEKTAKSLTEMFVNVVENGTGTAARIEGLKIAGKTGTAQRLVDGKYSSNSHNGTFVGYFPSENPAFLILVILNNPKSGDYYGGKVAAPVFRNIANRIIGFKGTTDFSNSFYVNAGNFNQENQEIAMTETRQETTLIPNLVNLKYEDALEILNENNLKHEVINEVKENSASGSNIIKVIESQIPLAHERIIQDNEVKIKLTVKEIIVQNDRLLTVPDVTNFSLRKAINKLVSEGFDIFISGKGKIIGQTPTAGSRQLPGSKVILFCKDHQ